MRSYLEAPGDKATMINNAHLSPPPALYLHLSTVNDLRPLWAAHLWTVCVLLRTKADTKHVVFSDHDRTGCSRKAKPAEHADTLFFFLHLVHLLLPRSPLVLSFFVLRISESDAHADGR